MNGFVGVALLVLFVAATVWALHGMWRRRRKGR